MTQNEADAGKTPSDFNRREFIRGASFGGLMLMMGGIPLHAEEKPGAAPADSGFKAESAPVACGVIGCGLWGKEIIQTLALLDKTPAPVVAICDNYKPALRKVADLAPKAQACEDYNQLLAQKDVEAVIIATPTHLHKEIVLAALQAGKHVYCEAPLANTIEDARAIALAAQAAPRMHFQAGLQMRADPGKLFIRDFVRSGALGDAVMARAQWHQRQTWRRLTPTPERDKALNWRLDKTISTGLAGEIGIHQLDLVSWFLNKKPLAITGFGGIMDPNLRDGRDVADTIQMVMQFPGKVNFTYDATLANSFDSGYEMLYGTSTAIMMRGNKAWMFKEVEAPLFGWEIYANKDTFYKETGISLVADASHSVKAGQPVEESPFADSTLHHALKAFVINAAVTSTEVKNYTESGFDAGDAQAFREHLNDMAKNKAFKPAAGFQEGFEATVLALKANEATLQGERLALPKTFFDL